KLIVEGGATNRILLTGYLPDIELAQLYKITTALILPSFYEGFGLPAIEAMAAGAPVIATSNSAIPEIAPDGALYIAPEDSTSLKRAMLQLLNNADLRKTLSERGKVYADRLNWESTAQKLLELLIEKK